MAKKAGTLDIEKLMAELNPEKTAKETAERRLPRLRFRKNQAL